MSEAPICPLCGLGMIIHQDSLERFHVAHSCGADRLMISFTTTMDYPIAAKVERAIAALRQVLKETE